MSLLVSVTLIVSSNSLHKSSNRRIEEVHMFSFIKTYIHYFILACIVANLFSTCGQPTRLNLINLPVIWLLWARACFSYPTAERCCHLRLLQSRDDRFLCSRYSRFEFHPSGQSVFPTPDFYHTVWVPCIIPSMRMKYGKMFYVLTRV